jgi:hypothetical protein
MDNFLVGKWNIETISPLGSDKYMLSVFETMSATISEMRGSMQFDGIKCDSNNFEMSGTTLTPTKAHVLIIGSLIDNQILGKIHINEYCTVDFKGTKNG